MSIALFDENTIWGLNDIECISVQNKVDINEMLDIIQIYKEEIEQKIEKLEIWGEYNFEVEKKIAVLIRQSQYLECLENLPKTELEELFL